LIDDYRRLIDGLADRLDEINLRAAIEIAKAAGEIGGYGLVKDASVAAYEGRLPKLLAAFEAAAAHPRSKAA
jgi:indolepyruvate ferredoxin oxidoreductase